MLWSLTKWNHKLSSNRLVRWWLRMTVLDRFIMVITVNIVYVIASFFAFSFWLVNFLAHMLVEGAVSGPLSDYLGEEIVSGGSFILGFMNFNSAIIIFFEVIFTIAVWAFTIFFVIDIIWDFIVTRNDLRNLTAKNNVILATRGEYVGGYPQLPHSRFVYLVISGTQRNPHLGIILPSSQTKELRVPLLDVTNTKSGKDDKFGQAAGIFNVSSAGITPSIWKGYRSMLNIEYTSAGRKYQIELGSFLRGNDEVQQWKNFLTCTQAEADTGKMPYGPWKSLPDKKESEE